MTQQTSDKLCLQYINIMLDFPRLKVFVWQSPSPIKYGFFRPLSMIAVCVRKAEQKSFFGQGESKPATASTLYYDLLQVEPNASPEVGYIPRFVRVTNT